MKPKYLEWKNTSKRWSHWRANMASNISTWVLTIRMSSLEREHFMDTFMRFIISTMHHGERVDTSILHYTGVQLRGSETSLY